MKIIHITNYLLIAEDIKPQEGDYGLGHAKGIKDMVEPHYFIFKHDDSPVAKLNAACKGSQTIIAHLPLINSPILEGVPLLPPLQPEEDSLELIAPPVAFECEVDYIGFQEEGDIDEPRKYTDSNGQTNLVGKYIYQL